MIRCPNCGQEEPEGTVFCSQCGTQLTGTDTLVTQTIHTNGMNIESLQPVPAVQRVAYPQLGSWMTLQLIESGRFIPLLEKDEFTLGRISEGQPIMPDIDLSPYRAYENGVSRLHAIIKRRNEKAFIMDLDSSNGVYVNGIKLTPNEEYPLKHGDIVSLGKLKIQVLLKNL